MKIISLKLKNFKGIKSFTLDTQGGNVDIYGDNATGKTTLFDAFTWLLFDKDSNNKKAFDIKTLNENSQPIRGLDHDVEAILDVDGKTITLAKSYKEKWTKKRGSATAEFTGHTTDHFINGVPVSKKEYDLQIEQIANEDTFKLLTSPSFFNEHLHWQDRRKILLGVCGDVSDDDVIASDKALAKLPAILGDHSMEEFRKIITARRAKINKELDKIPVRIDEVQQSMPDITGIIPEELTQKINTFKARIREKEQRIARIEGGGEVAERVRELREVESRMLELQNNHRARFDTVIREKQGQLDSARDNFYDLQSSIKGFERAIKGNQESIQKLQDRMEQLREYWHVVNNRTFEYTQSDTCPTCGQAIPTDQLAEAREKAQAEFNRKKAEELEAITNDGKGLKARVDGLVAENADIEQQLKDARSKLADAESEVIRLQKDIETLRQEADAYADSPEHKQLQERKQKLEQAIAGLKSGRQGEILDAQAEIRALEAEVQTCESRLANIERAKQCEKRIEELKEQERQLAAEYEKLEGELYLCEQFVRAKVAMLEERINSRFKMARFKLFDKQINGGLVEVCETMYRGVPYGSLNNAARINVGLDIIRTLSEYYGFAAPVFIDNAEAVTELVDPGTQVIRLIVSKDDKKLRVEYPARKEKRLLEEAV